MQTVSTSLTVTIPAPPWYCFDRYTDLASYPLWEPNTTQVTELERQAGSASRRMGFEVTRQLFGLPVWRLSYSLRCEVHTLGHDAFFIKFDEVEGDLAHVLTVVEFRPQGQGSTRMSYKSVIGDPYRFRRTLVALFGQAELDRHLAAFKGYVAQCLASGQADLSNLLAARNVA